MLLLESLDEPIAGALVIFCPARPLVRLLAATVVGREPYPFACLIPCLGSAAMIRIRSRCWLFGHWPGVSVLVIGPPLMWAGAGVTRGKSSVWQFDSGLPGICLLARRFCHAQAPTPLSAALDHRRGERRGARLASRGSNTMASASWRAAMVAAFD
jgi:hypothetical protein